VNDAEKVEQILRRGTGREMEDRRVETAHVFDEMGVRCRCAESDGGAERRRERVAGHRGQVRDGQPRASSHDAVRDGDDERACQQRQQRPTAHDATDERQRRTRHDARPSPPPPPPLQNASRRRLTTRRHVRLGSVHRRVVVRSLRRRHGITADGRRCVL